MAFAKELVSGALSPGTAGTIGGQYAAVTAAGSVQGDATALGSSLSIIAGADGTKGIILPAAQVGDQATVFNNSASTLKVWPDVGAAIAVPGTGLGTANTAFSHLTYKTVIYTRVTSTQWLSNTTA